MDNFYVYLISSLPMLHFGMKPAFSFEEFLEVCRDKISRDDIRTIEAARDGMLYAGEQPTLRQWSAFDTALRNELVKIRAVRRHLDPFKYLRGDRFIEPHIARIAMNAHRTTSVMDAEKLLDQGRWQKLDELSAGHYFDLDFLICYALKLLILERRDKVNSQDKPKLLDEALN